MHGIRYFKCRSRHGVFVRHDKVVMDKKRRGSRKQAKDAVKRQSIGAKLPSTGVNHVTSPGNATQVSPGSGAGGPSFMKSTSASSAKKNR